MVVVGDLTLGLAVEAVIGVTVTAVGVLLVVRGENVAGSVRDGRAWLVSFHAHGRHRKAVAS